MVMMMMLMAQRCHKADSLAFISQNANIFTNCDSKAMKGIVVYYFSSFLLFRLQLLFFLHFFSCQFESLPLCLSNAFYSAFSSLHFIQNVYDL